MPRILLPHRSIIRINGMDSENYLQGLISNDIRKASSDSLLYALLLTPQGKMLYDFFIMKEDHNSYLIDVPNAYLDQILKKLDMYKLRVDVQISVVPNMGVGVSRHATSTIDYEDPRSKTFYYRCFVEKDQLENNEELLLEYHKDRVELTIPELSLDFMPQDFYPLELRMDKLNAIDYKKGCYVGQEVTARTTYRGSVRKSLYKIEFMNKDDDSYPDVGSEVTYNGAVIGYLMKVFGSRAMAILNTEKAVALIEEDQVLAVNDSQVKIS